MKFRKKPVVIEAVQYTEEVRAAHIFDGRPLPDGVSIHSRYRRQRRALPVQARHLRGNLRTCGWRGDAMSMHVGMQVWFRPGRMYGYPEREPIRGMVSNVRPNGRVDLELGCDGMSGVSGEANSVPHRSTIAPALAEQLACWWEVEQGDTGDGNG